MRQYAVITILESAAAKQYTMSSLPLHVTLLSIFFSAENPECFIKILGDVVAKMRPIKVKAIGRAMFGVDKDIPVTLVDTSDDLQRLHLRLLDAVSARVTFRAPQFAGAGFGPHITDQQGRSISVDTELLLDNLTLVEIIDQDVFVRSDHSLGAEA